MHFSTRRINPRQILDFNQTGFCLGSVNGCLNIAVYNTLFYILLRKIVAAFILSIYDIVPTKKSTVLGRDLAKQGVCEKCLVIKNIKLLSECVGFLLTIKTHLFI